MPYLSQQQIATLTFLIIATLMMIISPAHSASGRYCKIDHYHSGSGDEAKSHAQAKASAARAWSSFTAWEYGNKWSNISIAMNTKYSCSHPTTGWKCTVVAKPCKYSGAARKVRKKARRSRKASRKRTYRRKAKSRRKAKRRVRARRIKAKKWTMAW